MGVPMGKIRTVMARTASSNGQTGGKGSPGKARSGDTKVMDPERSSTTGILTAYRRDIACFVMVILAVLFCASEWFRVQGVFGRALHALASGALGLMSVVLPVFLALVVFSLMRKTERRSENARMALGWLMILWSICSILDAAMASDSPAFDIALLQRSGGLLGYVLGCPLAWGLSKAFAIIIFVVVILFSLLLITHTRVTDIPDGLRMMGDRFGVGSGKTHADDEAEQFPNEVRVGDTTLAFAEGVPSHDGTDAGDDDQATRGLFSRMSQWFSSRRRGKDEQGKLDHYAGDEAFLNAASSHGETAETMVQDPYRPYQPVGGVRTISSMDAPRLRPPMISPAIPRPWRNRLRVAPSRPNPSARQAAPCRPPPLQRARSSRSVPLPTIRGPPSTKTGRPMAMP